MTTYEKSFKEEAVKLSDEIGIKKAAQQLGIPYYTLADWRHRQNIHGSQAHVGSGHKRMSADEKERRIKELEALSRILCKRRNAMKIGKNILWRQRRFPVLPCL